MKHVLAMLSIAAFSAVSQAGQSGPGDYTGSHRLTYEHFDCLAVSPRGVVRVTAGPTCAGAEWPELWIVFHDAAGRPITDNEYLFRLAR